MILPKHTVLAIAALATLSLSGITSIAAAPGDFLITSESVEAIGKQTYLYDTLQGLDLDDAQVMEFIDAYKGGEAKPAVIRRAEAQSKKNTESEKDLVSQLESAIKAVSETPTRASFDKAKAVFAEIKYTNVTELEEKLKSAESAVVKAEQERKAQEEAQHAEEDNKKKEEEAEKQAHAAQSSQALTHAQVETARANGTPYFGPDGLLVMSGSGDAQQAVNLLLGIPGHSNGAWYHQSTGLDNVINSLSVEEATWVIHRIEGAGFGQTGAGWAGIDSAASHQAFLNQQVHGRFGGSVHELLRQWGTFSYGGY